MATSGGFDAYTASERPALDGGGDDVDAAANGGAVDPALPSSSRRRSAWSTRRKRERILVVGSGKIASRVALLSEVPTGRSLHVVGCLDDDPPPLGDGPPVLGGLADLSRVLAEHDVDRVIVSFSRRGDADLVPVLRRCEASGVTIDVVPRFFELVGFDGGARVLGGLPLISLSSHRPGRVQRAVKRALDVAVALVLLSALLPLLTLIAAAIVVQDGGRVLYRSRRLGRGGRTFSMLKFRTMVAQADADQLVRAQALLSGQLKPTRDPRITPLGRLLRRTSLDELPQLFNVLVGDMSLVGPRPILESEATGMSGLHGVRHDVRPGITGPWQIHGRSGLSWEDRMQLDCAYVRRWSLRSDLAILLRTVPVVLAGRGAF